MPTPENTGVIRDEKGRFPPGVSGNPAGKPRGSRHKLEESFLRALVEDFEANGVATVESLRQNDPATYSRIIASLVTKQAAVDVTHHDAETVSEQQARIMAEAYLDRAARTEKVG